MNSHLSLARFSGGCVIDGKHYLLNYKTKDLIRSDFVKTYQKIERDKIIEMLKDGKSKKEIEEYAKSIAPAPKPAKAKKIEPPRLDL